MRLSTHIRFGVWVALAGLSACATQSNTGSGGEGNGDGKAVAPKPPEVRAEEAFEAEVKVIESEMKDGQPSDWEDVADRMREVAEHHPSYGLAWYNLGVAEERQGRRAQAEEAYRRAMANGGPREAQVNLAAMALAAGDERQAFSMLRDQVDRDPGAAQARLSLAEVSAARGEFEEATRLAREALGRLPKEIRAYCVLAEASLADKDFTRTRLIASQGFKLDENAACLHFALANMHMAEKETAKALASYERAAQLDPQLVEARFRIAEVSMSYKDFARAAANFRAITEAQPTNAGAYVNLGVAAKGGNNLELAEQSYLKAIEVAGAEPVPAAHFNLGVLYLKHLNRLDDAQTHLKRYLQVGNAGSDDKAFGLLEEIAQRRAMEIEMKRMEEEAARQAEIDAKVAAEEAKKAKAEEEKNKAAPGTGEPKPAGEPADPTPPIDP